MITPDFESFEKKSTQGNLVPVYREILADLETPVSVYRKFSQLSNSFLLESVENGEQLGRYSFLGAEPFLSFEARGTEQKLTTDLPELNFKTQASPMDTLRDIMNHFNPVKDANLPPFSGGAVGMMSYDAVRYFENIPDNNPNDLDVPDLYFLVADSIVAFDHVKRRMILIVNALINGDAKASYDKAVKKLDRLYEIVTGPDPEIKEQEFSTSTFDPQSNMTQEAFHEMIEKGKEYIYEGDIFQVVLSQRFSTDLTCAPFDIYRALRAVNPSPYMFYMDCKSNGDGGFQLAGSSPEILVRCKDRVVELRPIAGTRPRGKSPEEDLALEKELLADEKEIAEHVMLVDLGRNDVGRVSKYNTVRVTDLQFIERYSHVMHIVSNVVGELQDDKDAFDVLAASFPAGTLSGAPKIRAMEIIDELETSRRGPYGGSVVYIDFSGNMDSCIIIRTAFIKDGKVHVQAGGGVVADSTGEGERQESISKSMGVRRAVEWATQGLDQ